MMASRVSDFDTAKHRQSGFSLIELLVVMSIIGLLLGLLLPVLARSREEANSLICTTNLDSIFKATYLYTTDHDEYLPNFAYLDTKKEWWITQIADGLDRNLEIYLCPSDQYPYQVTEVVRGEGGKITVSRRSQPGRFTLDLSYRGTCDFMASGMRRITDPPDPSQTLMLLEAQASDEDAGGRECAKIGHHLGTLGTDEWDVSTRIKQTWKRHNGSSHFLFMDGGVDWLTPSGGAALAPRLRVGPR